MKLYTKRGDSGETDLFGGGRVPKDALRVEAYGSVDELNAVLGFAISTLTPGPSPACEAGAASESDAGGRGEQDNPSSLPPRGGGSGWGVDLAELLESIQSDLFRLGAELATAPTSDPEKLRARTTPVTAERITELEGAIDGYEEELEPLRNFILPGGCEAAARLQVARTVCRRAERRVVALARKKDVSAELVKYLNRLSDLLFVLTRVANKRTGVKDIEWKG